MKRSLMLASLLALAACDRAETDEASPAETTGIAEVDPNAEAGFEAIAPGNYEIVHGDGRIDQLTVRPGMTWAMVYSDGQAAGGTIFEQGGEKCFVTEGVEGHQCFSGTEPAGDGSVEVTGADGAKATVRPVETFD